MAELCTTILAAACGIMMFPKLNTFYRLLLLQVLIYLAGDSLASQVNNNGWCYNILILMETPLLLIMAQAYFATLRSKLVLFFSFLIFLTVYVASIPQLDKFREQPLNIYAIVTEGVLFTIVCLIMLYQEFFKLKSMREKLPVIMVALGMLIYFAGSTPYLSMIVHIQAIDPKANLQLFFEIIIFLGEIRYLFIAIAFFLTGYQGRLFPLKQNTV